MSLTSKLKANKTFIAGAAFFTSANLADLLMTEYGLTHGGTDSNLILQGIFDNYGLNIFLAAKILIGAALIPLAYHNNNEGKKVAEKYSYRGLSKYAPQMGNILMYGGAAVMGIATLHNITQVL